MVTVSQVHNDIINKTKNGADIPIADKGGVKVHALTIFEDIVLRNFDNLDTVALEVNGTQLTYKDFFVEVEKYMSSFLNMGLKENDVVSLCLPVSIEFICSYFALTALGITCNALNIMFLLSEGVKPYLDERCSETLLVNEDYYKMLQMKGAFNDPKLKTIILTGDAIYNHFNGDSDEIIVPDCGVVGTDILTFNDFLKNANSKDVLKTVKYDENRIATLTYTSGTTGKPKCMGHSDLAALFLVAAHDNIKRDEYRGDRTLLTIPLQHPTGLFYAMVFQMAQGKTLVLEPRYDKKLFSTDIKSLEINHAVQAKPFYAQLIQDRADGILKSGDFEKFRNAYSGGEGIPLSVCRAINDTLAYAGCKNPLYLGYGRSEEGSLVIAPYNMCGRENTCGMPMPGITAKIVDPDTLRDIPQIAGAKGEIVLNTPVHPINYCYLGPYNTYGKPDGSFVGEDGIRYSRPGDIDTYVEMPDKSLSHLPLGRAGDSVIKNGKVLYLFDLKEDISNIYGIQECEVLCMSNTINTITVHIILTDEYKRKYDEMIRNIYEEVENIDAVKIYDTFGVNATSGKCDREKMKNETTGYYSLIGNQICQTEFLNKGNHMEMVVKNK